MDDYVKSFDGLSTRSKNALWGYGYRNKQDVKDAIRTGEIRKTSSGTTIPNLGKKSLLEVFEWAGIEEDCREIEKAKELLERQGYEVIKK